MKSANIHEVLRSFPEFERAYVALKEEARERYNWAIDSLAYMPGGMEIYDEDERLIAIPLNDEFMLVAVESGDDFGYKIVAAAADEEE